MNDKDLILETMISNPNRNQGSYYTPKSLKDHLFPNHNVDQVDFLLKEIIKEKPELLKITKVIGTPFAVEPSGLIDSFLEKGGFTKIEKDQEIETRANLKREEKKDQLLDLDLKLRKFENKIGKKIIIAGIIITALSFLITVITLEFWKNENEQKDIFIKNPSADIDNSTLQDNLN